MKQGLVALSPIVVLLCVYLSMSLASGDFYQISISVALRHEGYTQQLQS
jgi:hypothetical protein